MTGRCGDGLANGGVGGRNSEFVSSMMQRLQFVSSPGLTGRRSTCGNSPVTALTKAKIQMFTIMVVLVILKKQMGIERYCRSTTGPHLQMKTGKTR